MGPASHTLHDSSSASDVPRTQASPYVMCLFLVPCHYLTHVAMLFFTAVWATNIHDSLAGDTEPVMGSKYHTMHHTHYHYNFGQFFIFCDYIFGTLRVPEPRGPKAALKAQKLQ
jgi:Delta7-sterol 5-desaturase